MLAYISMLTHTVVHLYLITNRSTTDRKQTDWTTLAKARSTTRDSLLHLPDDEN